jgi:hypothetical protein
MYMLLGKPSVLLLSSKIAVYNFRTMMILVISMPETIYIECYQMDNVISHAQATLGALMTQRSTFGGITTKISNVSSRLPSVRIKHAMIKQLSHVFM